MEESRLELKFSVGEKRDDIGLRIKSGENEKEKTKYENILRIRNLR